jgi:hypothetical protein
MRQYCIISWLNSLILVLDTGFDIWKYNASSKGCEMRNSLNLDWKQSNENYLIFTLNLHSSYSKATFELLPVYIFRNQAACYWGSRREKNVFYKFFQQFLLIVFSGKFYKNRNNFCLSYSSCNLTIVHREFQPVVTIQTEKYSATHVFFESRKG